MQAAHCMQPLLGTTAHLRLGGVAAQALAVLNVPPLNQVLHDVAVVAGLVHCAGGGRGGGRGR